MSPELEHIRREVERLTHGWSESDWQNALASNRTCRQILEHLLLSYSSTTQDVLNVMEVGRPLGGKPTWSHRWRTLCVAKLGLLPWEFVPLRQPPPKDGLESDSLRRFYDTLVALDATLSDAERRFGNRVKLLDHPILGPLSVQEWRRYHRAHAKHHLRQMKRARR